MILVLEGLVQLPVPVEPPRLEVREPILLDLSHNLADLLQHVLPLGLLPQKVCAHQFDDFGLHLLVVPCELVVLPRQVLDMLLQLLYVSLHLLQISFMLSPQIR